MDDTVSRRVAIDAMCEACSDWCDEGVCKKVSAIQKLPSAEPESIKCEDCGHAEERGCMLFCKWWMRYTAHKGYCVKAEGRTG